jgi:integrase
VGVARAKAPDDPRRRRMDWDSVVPGLALRTTATGSKSWVLVTRFDRKVIFVTLGKSPGLSLPVARTLAREGLERIARGEDPRRPKRPVGAIPTTVEAVAARFVEEWCRPRNRQWHEQERLLRHCVLPVWGPRRLAEITRADVIVLTDAIAKRTPAQANRALAVLKRFFGWALDRDLIAAHPAVGLHPPGREHVRTRVLEDAELRPLWAAWDRMGFPMGRALQFVVATAGRRGEVAGLAWTEIDPTERVWTIPAARFKSGIPLVVPLSSLALDVLARCPRIDGCDFVFTTRGQKPIRDWSGPVKRATKLSGVNGWRPHDLRRTVRTNLSRLGVPADVGERVLGHLIPGVRGRYDRYAYLAEKRDALQRWAAHVSTVTRVSTQDRAILPATLGELARRTI